jgi:hypothetical protein
MQKRNILWLVLIFVAFCLMGCFSTPKTPKIRDIPYTFGAHKNNNETATIFPQWGIRFVDVEGEVLPPAGEGIRWRPLLFPAKRDLNIRLYATYAGDHPGYRRRGIFKCPPLEANKKYKLWYEPAKRHYYSGAGKLILTYDKVKELKYILGIPRYKQIHVQEIPPL